jgi:hypothetical protein
MGKKNKKARSALGRGNNDRYAEPFSGRTPPFATLLPLLSQRGELGRVNGKSEKERTISGAGFSHITDIRMTDNAFLLGNLRDKLYWFDTEGVKKNKKQWAVVSRQ